MTTLTAPLDFRCLPCGVVDEPLVVAWASAIRAALCACGARIGRRDEVAVLETGETVCAGCIDY